MDMRDLLGRFGEQAGEAARQALGCGTLDDLLELAEEHDVELSAQEGEEVLAFLRRARSGELSASELDAVTGGEDKDSPECPYCRSSNVKPATGSIALWECLNCGRTFVPNS